MKILLLTVAACLLVSSTLGQLQIQKCKKGSVPTKLAIEGCSKAPCTIVNGQNLKFSAEFINPTATSTLRAKVIPRLAGFVIPYELPKEHHDGCQKLNNAKCPLEANQRIEASGDVPVESPVSNVKINIEFQLHADSGMAVCFKIDARVVNK